MPDDILNRREDVGHHRRPARWGGMVLMTLAGFAAGGGLVGWMVMHGAGPGGMMGAAWHQIAPEPSANAPVASPSGVSPVVLIASQNALEARIVLAEQRLDRIDMQASAAAGNAARAEALLVAFATRRIIERGGSLGYLEDQLRQRFGDAQPRAVAVLVAASHGPVTRDGLSARLQAMAGRIGTGQASESLWQRTSRALANMFTIRRDTPGAATPDACLNHAQVALREGAVEVAIAEVQRLPASRETGAWLSDARRYAEAEAALDRIETAALLEPHALGDGAGRRLAPASPLAAPPTGAPASAAPATGVPTTGLPSAR